MKTSRYQEFCMHERDINNQIEMFIKKLRFAKTPAQKDNWKKQIAKLNKMRYALDNEYSDVCARAS